MANSDRESFINYLGPRITKADEKTRRQLKKLMSKYKVRTISAVYKMSDSNFIRFRMEVEKLV